MDSKSQSFASANISLSEKEFKLALFLFENHERAVSRERLMQEVWAEQGKETHYLDHLMFMSRGCAKNLT